MHKFYIYHVLGEKIGCTHDLDKRVIFQQGCEPTEFDVLEEHDDIVEASHREIELQKQFNYKQDSRLYCQNFKQMILKQSSPTVSSVGVNKQLKSKLELKNLLAKGVIFQTDMGTFDFDHKNVDELMKISQSSKFQGGDYYFSIRALRNLHQASAEVDDDKLRDLDDDLLIEDLMTLQVDATVVKPPSSIDDSIDAITVWAKDLGITNNTIEAQTLKLVEEVGELSKGVLDKDSVEVRDAIGDIVVVLTSLSIIHGTTLKQCISEVLEEIKSREAIVDDHGNVVATVDPNKSKNTK